MILIPSLITAVGVAITLLLPTHNTVSTVSATASTYSINQTFYFSASDTCSNSSLFGYGFSSPNNASKIPPDICTPTPTCKAISTNMYEQSPPTEIPIGKMQTCETLPTKDFDYTMYYYQNALQAFNGNPNTALIAFFTDKECLIPNGALISLPGVCVANVPGSVFNYYIGVAADGSSGSLYSCGSDPTCSPENCSPDPVQSISAADNNTCVYYNALGRSGYVRSIYKKPTTNNNNNGGQSSSITTAKSSTSSPTGTALNAGTSKNGGVVRRLQISWPVYVCTSASLLISLLVFA